MDSNSNVLITGCSGFTGQYIKKELTDHGFMCFPLKSDLLHKEDLKNEITSICPDYVIHLGAISYVDSFDIESIYKVNLIGSLNLFEALKRLRIPPKKVIIASSAAVYGNSSSSKINESASIMPVSQYGCSKYAMELLSKNYKFDYEIIIARPFNYTGIGHAQNFVIPKIVKAYIDKKKEVELGNIDIHREFNDVRDVSSIYRKLLHSNLYDDVVNICTGRVYSLRDIIIALDKIHGYEMNVKSKPLLKRINEIKTSYGCPNKLNSIIVHNIQYSLEDTLRWMSYG